MNSSRKESPNTTDKTNQPGSPNNSKSQTPSTAPHDLITELTTTLGIDRSMALILLATQPDQIIFSYTLQKMQSQRTRFLAKSHEQITTEHVAKLREKIQQQEGIEEKIAATAVNLNQQSKIIATCQHFSQLQELRNTLHALFIKQMQGQVSIETLTKKLNLAIYIATVFDKVIALKDYNGLQVRMQQDEKTQQEMPTILKFTADCGAHVRLHLVLADESNNKSEVLIPALPTYQGPKAHWGGGMDERDISFNCLEDFLNNIIRSMIHCDFPISEFTDSIYKILREELQKDADYYCTYGKLRPESLLVIFNQIMPRSKENKEKNSKAGDDYTHLIIQLPAIEVTRAEFNRWEQTLRPVRALLPMISARLISLTNDKENQSNREKALKEFRLLVKNVSSMIHDDQLAKSFPWSERHELRQQLAIFTNVLEKQSLNLKETALALEEPKKKYMRFFSKVGGNGKKDVKERMASPSEAEKLCKEIFAPEQIAHIQSHILSQLPVDLQIEFLVRAEDSSITLFPKRNWQAVENNILNKYTAEKIKPIIITYLADHHVEQKKTEEISALLDKKNPTVDLTILLVDVELSEENSNELVGLCKAAMKDAYTALLKSEKNTETEVLKKQHVDRNDSCSTTLDEKENPKTIMQDAKGNLKGCQSFEMRDGILIQAAAAVMKEEPTSHTGLFASLATLQQNSTMEEITAYRESVRRKKIETNPLLSSIFKSANCSSRNDLDIAEDTSLQQGGCCPLFRRKK
ncbi:MAG: hypothetical protein ACD_45C00690G0005 [uncultured bacterium]|nr:MAG: hypothetical protein ACD_45C00690G0005 [uncultured bacterium]